MRTAPFVALLLLAASALGGCGRTEKPAPPPAAAAVDPLFVESATAATERLRSELQQELRGALVEGGPEQAIEICRTRAAAIASDVSQHFDLDVHRVAVRARRPENRADAVEEAVLAAFASRPSLADTAFVSDGRPVFMRAIRIDGPACLGCHGPTEELSPGVRALLAQHYPDDEATGFAMGDLRGAFVVR